MSNLTIEEIKQSLDIVELAEKYGAHPKRKTGKTILCKYNILRPTDKSSNLTLYPQTNTWTDFGNKSGSIIDFIMLAENITMQEAINRIKEMAGIVDENYIKPIIRDKQDFEVAKVLPDVIKKIFNYQKVMTFEKEEHKKELLAIAPEWLYKECAKDDLVFFNNTVRFDAQHQSAFMICIDNKIERGARYRRKRKFDEDLMQFSETEYDDAKWIAYTNTRTNFPYIRLKNDGEFVLIVEGSHDYLTAILCGYNVIALPSSGYMLSQELLNDKICVFLDDDDGKNFMQPLFEQANCSKILFNHSEFKKKHKIKKAKDFSDYVECFSNLNAFKEAFNEQCDFVNSVSTVSVDSRLKCVSSLIDNIIAPSWMIKNILPSEGLVEIIGASNSYKTFITLDMMYCISNGIDYHGMKTKKGTVVYIAGEGANGAKMRLRALRAKYGHNTDNFFMLQCSANLSDYKEMDKLSSEIASLTDDKINLIVFDTLHRNTAGIDENSASDFALVLGNVDKYLKPYVNVIAYIHHTGNGAETSMRGRGTSARFAAMDTSIVIHSKVKGNAGMTCVKQKDGDAFETIFFDMEKVDIDLKDEDGESLFSVVPILGTEKAGEEKEETTKDLSSYAETIKDYLLSKQCEVLQKDIVEDLKGKIPLRKIKDILWHTDYRNVLWSIRSGEKKSYYFSSLGGVQTVEYTEEDYKVELPLCLR